MARAHLLRLALASLTLPVVVACTAPPPPAPEAPAPVAQPAPAPAPVASPPPPPAPPPTPVPLEEAVARSGERLFADAVAQLNPLPRDLVIDPLIDGSTAQQTVSSVQMGRQLAEILASRYPQLRVQPLTRETLQASPILVIGTLTAIHTDNVQGELANAFRICLALIDLRTGKVVAKRPDRATIDSVNAEPTPYYRDSPTWHRDRTTSAYISACQATKLGDTVSPAYLMRLPAAAVLNQATLAYEANRMEEAYRLYRDARAFAEPDDLRVLNGMYLTSWRTGKRDEASQAFGDIVRTGLETKRLPMRLLFAVGGTSLIGVPDLRAQYGLWLRQIARQSAELPQGCVRVVGHASPTGSAAANDALSLRRAEAIRQQLEREAATLRGRLTAEGKGSRETLIGLGTDDIRDALDRRVEFRVEDCPAR